MCLGDRAADRQSHAHAARLGRVERIEQVRQALRLQSRPGIAHRDDQTDQEKSSIGKAMSFARDLLREDAVASREMFERGKEAGISRPPLKPWLS